ncbi:MAG: GNAT family N-acetyltransferase [Tepidisphaeraceae bacterium]|jgi:putative acetyltransferase
MEASSPPWTIRSFRPADLPACRKLYVEGLLGGKLAENDTGLDIDDIEAVYMHTAGNHFWVAEIRGQIVGMIGVQHHDQGVGQVRRLRVAQEHRRRGIGSALLETAITFCRENQCLKVALDTFTERSAAVEMFQKLGFRHGDTRMVAGKELMYFYFDLYSGPPRARMQDHGTAPFRQT